MENKALGRGLSALIPDKIKQEKTEEGEKGSVLLKTHLILDNSLQPRTDYADEKLEELKASIKEKGILQPILVRKKGNKYEVIAGERRLRAARALHLEEVPVIIKELSDRDSLVVALVENIQREDLNAIEEAEAFKKLIEEFHFTQDEVARSVGKDRVTVSNLLRLLKLPLSIQRMVSQDQISAGHAKAILGLKSIQDQEDLAHKIITKKLSVRQVEAFVRSKIVQSVQSGQIGQIGQKIKGYQKTQDIISLEEDLCKVLGTKVQIIAKKNKGRLVIEYYSLDDLDRIIDQIKK